MKNCVNVKKKVDLHAVFVKGPESHSAVKRSESLFSNRLNMMLTDVKLAFTKMVISMVFY